MSSPTNWAGLVSLAFLAGCATMFNSDNQCYVRVETPEPGVPVRVLNRGELVCERVTPFDVKLESSAGYFRRAEYEFLFSGAGETPESVFRFGEIAGSYWVNFLTLEFFPIGMLIVDPLSGSMFKIDDAPVFANVAPEGKSVTPSKALAPLYRLVSLERAAGDGVSYDFKLGLSENLAISGVKAVQAELSELVSNSYVGSDQAVSRQDVRVEFPEFRIANGMATGRAVVVAVTVVLLRYDDASRKGVIRVRYPVAQYEVARKWVRDHIENLARDKNIALTTGEIPPAARFYLGTERVLPDNVLEVEFETE